MCVREKQRGRGRDRVPSPWEDELEPVAMLAEGDGGVVAAVVLPVATASPRSARVIGGVAAAR